MRAELLGAHAKTNGPRDCPRGRYRSRAREGPAWFEESRCGRRQALEGGDGREGLTRRERSPSHVRGKPFVQAWELSLHLKQWRRSRCQAATVSDLSRPL